MTLQYHQAIFDLLGIEPIIDIDRTEAIKKIENAYQIQLPESVKEYFLIANMLETLFQYNVFMEVNPLFLFGQLEYFEGLNDKHLELLKERKIVPLFTEKNQSCTWFLNLKTPSKDPKMMLFSSASPGSLASHPHKFSKQLYLSIWDTQVIEPRSEGFSLRASHSITNQKTLKLLRHMMREISTTYLLIKNETTYRFENHDHDTCIAIIEDGMTSNWYFHALDENGLQYLFKVIQKISYLIDKVEFHKSIENDETEQKKEVLFKRLLEDLEK